MHLSIPCCCAPQTDRCSLFCSYSVSCAKLIFFVYAVFIESVYLEQLLTMQSVLSSHNQYNSMGFVYLSFYVHLFDNIHSCFTAQNNKNTQLFLVKINFVSNTREVKYIRTTQEVKHSGSKIYYKNK